MEFNIRPAVPKDSGAILSVLKGIASERIYTAVSKPWSARQQRQHQLSLSPREAIHVAESMQGKVIGYQVLELWAATLDSMSHVGQIGTFLAPECRRQGIGHALFRRTLEFAKKHNYRKLLIQVRSSNLHAQGFYQQLGFRECGRLAQQVRIGDLVDDEVLMEMFIE